MKFKEKIGKIEIYELNKEETAEFGVHVVGIESGDLNIFNFKDTVLAFKAGTVKDALIKAALFESNSSVSKVVKEEQKEHMHASKSSGFGG